MQKLDAVAYLKQRLKNTNNRKQQKKRRIKTKWTSLATNMKYRNTVCTVRYQSNISCNRCEYIYLLH